MTTPCPHPPHRLYSWFAPDPVRAVKVQCTVCCDCGAVLQGAWREDPITETAAQAENYAQWQALRAQIPTWDKLMDNTWQGFKFPADAIGDAVLGFLSKLTEFWDACAGDGWSLHYLVNRDMADAISTLQQLMEAMQTFINPGYKAWLEPQRAFVAHDGKRCPNCGSSEIEDAAIDFDPPHACRSCGAIWQPTYHLTGFAALEVPEQEEGDHAQSI